MPIADRDVQHQAEHRRRALRRIQRLDGDATRHPRALPPGTERYLSISIWDSREVLMAMRDRVPPGGPIGIKPDAMAIYDVEQSGGPAV